MAGEEVDQPTNATEATQKASNVPPSEAPGQAETGEAPFNEPRQGESLQSKVRPAAVPEEPADAHAALDEAIEHARAAVAHLDATRAATRHQSGADAPAAAVHSGRPAYWAEPELEL